MKNVLKWIIKKLFVLMLFAIMGFTAYRYYERNAAYELNRIPRADTFAAEFLRAELNKDFQSCRAMVYDGIPEGQSNTASFEDTFSVTWNTLQDKLDKGLFKGWFGHVSRTDKKFRKLIKEMEYGGIEIIDGFPSIWFEFGGNDNILRIAVTLHNCQLKIIAQSYGDFTAKYCAKP